MFAKGQTIIQIFEQLAPKHLAVPDDKIGLQVGTLNKEIRKIMLTLDVLENVIDEAIEKRVDLIISHHAMIFRPLKNIRTDMYQGRVIEKLIKHDIAAYTAHTNLDAAEGGVNDALAKNLELQNIEILDPIYPLDLQGKQYGIGRLGQLKEPESLGNFAQWVKKKFHLDGLRIVGDLSQMVKKVAVVGGDGHSYINKAAFKGADVLVTGDIDYHVAHDAMAQGLALIDVGHHIEKEVLKEVKLFLEKEFLNRRISTEIVISDANTNPFRFM